MQTLKFGVALNPVRCGNDLVIGGGEVYPEINFTLPSMVLDAQTWPTAVSHYDQIASMVFRAARRMKLAGLVVEFELLPPMTENPIWGSEITQLLAGALRKAHETCSLRSALRVTPVDLHDAIRPQQLRSGTMWEAMRRAFHACAAAGADILSIESVGGKEFHDEAMMYGGIPGIIFALGVLAPRDMAFLWDEIVRISMGFAIISEAAADEKIVLPKPERAWLSRIERGLDSLPQNEETLIASMKESYGSKFDPRSYEL